TSARLKETTARGSNPAFNTSVRILFPSISPWTASRGPIFPANLRSGCARNRTTKKALPTWQCLVFVRTEKCAASRTRAYESVMKGQHRLPPHGRAAGIQGVDDAALTHVSLPTSLKNHRAPD